MARGARSFIAALMLALLALCLSVYGCARSGRLFARGLTRWVDRGAVDMTDAELTRFAEDTLSYLTGRAESWNPTMRVHGRTIGVPEGFGAHMASVRRVFRSAPWVLAALAAVGLALTLWAKRGFSRAGWTIGLLAPAVLLAALAAWAAIDFGGFWGALHRALIPDGIFSDAETVWGVMRLFPAELFAGYVAPVGIAYLLMTLALALAPRWLNRKALMK